MAKIHTQIRLERAARRQSKTIYSSCPKERKIEKLLEENEQLRKDMSSTWKIMYNKGFIAGKDNQNPMFFSDFDFILYTEKRIEKNNKQIDRICKQIGNTEDEIIKWKYQRNAGRSSQSF